MPKILVVDDEEQLLGILRDVLEDEGYKVLTASSGPVALDILEKEKVDLVLLDIMMPEMDGWAVVEEINKRPHIKDVPIAMLTVKTLSPQYFYSDATERLIDYINKPFSNKVLKERVKNILETRSRMESIKESLRASAPDFVGEYEELLRTEKLYENLLKSLEFSLTKMEKSSSDYKLIKDAFNYASVLLEEIKKKREAHERLIEETKLTFSRPSGSA
ncbi:MAG: two-component system response regulator [Candidatus Hydrothermarchaeales archaeon]